MATNDWEKETVGFNTDFISWRNGDITLWVVQEWKYTVMEKNISDNVQIWTVQIEDGTHVINKKEFNTKQQAMSWAKTYMRKH